jgi:hypothetical protein
MNHVQLTHKLSYEINKTKSFQTNLKIKFANKRVTTFKTLLNKTGQIL